MRIALIHVMQETDTFNPVPTTLTDFKNVALLEGAAILSRVDPNGPIAGFLEAIRTFGKDVEVIPILRADAQSGGRLSRQTLSALCQIIQSGLSAAGKCDGLMVFLHGAACAEGVDDVEGEILSIIREKAGNDIPIALMLDHHANITNRMIDSTNLLMAFRTQPHDPFETARDLTEIALRLFSRQISVTMAWQKIPMITHQEQFLTARGPMKEWFDHARQCEASGQALTVSLFPMQPWIDVEEAGWSVVVATENDRASAEQIADELAQHAWSLRHQFMQQENLSTTDAITFADDSVRQIVLLSDTGDSVLGGSTGDSTVILRALLDAKIHHQALVPITDPLAAKYLATCDIGATVTVNLGGWANNFYSPIEVTGNLQAAREGIVTLPDLPQGSVDMGKSAILKVGNVSILVTEFPGVGGIHPGVYRHLGVEPGEFKMIVMKTASNFQYMKQLTTDFVRVATPGPTQSDVHSLPWSRVPRPIFPLDEMKDWRI